ncbi:MAG: DNA-directed DNA polymerase [Candidatus Asgardarchaeia archaeon]
MSEIIFWPIDVAYTIIDGIPYIEIWGISEDNKRVVVLDGSFRPYFYAIPKENADLEILQARIRKLNGVKSTNVAEKKFLGKKVTVIKVICTNPNLVPKVREEVNRLQNVDMVLEADIRFYMRYLIDNDIYPCRWYIVDAVRVKGPAWEKYKVDEVYVANNVPREIKKESIPKLRLLAFDIETYSKLGTPNPKRDPIIIISVATSNGDLKIFEASEDKNDKAIIESFVNFVQEYDPDFIFGYNSNRFDWIYLVERARIHGIQLAVDRKGNMPHPSVYGHQSVAGRANVDLLDYAEGLYEVKVKTLKNVAEYLGITPKKERVIIPQAEIASYWDDKTKRPLLIEYAKDDVVSTIKIGELALPFVIELSRLVGLTPDQILAASVGFRVEWYLMRQAFKENELIPNRSEKEHEAYPGALVFEPKKGLHKNVVYMDFASMYPSLIIKYNIGPDTYVPPYEKVPDDEVWICPEFGHRFRKDPPGLYKKSLSKLMVARKEIKSKLKELDERTVEYKLLDNRQKAVKVIMNATYGYAGWSGARWYMRPVAEATTAWGRQTILRAKEIAEELGLTVYYGDTDSLFLEYDPEKIKKFEEQVEKELGLDIKADRIFKSIFFTEAKKRYAGIDTKGLLEVTGFEVVRGDWAEIAREVQEEILRIILEKEDVNEAVKYVREVIKSLRERKIPYEKLVIWKTISRALNEYKARAPHITAARILQEHGYQITPGTQVGFVITKGTGILAERAMPYQFAKYEDVDIEYYIEKQIIPVALRILSAFGISEVDLKTEKRQVSLTDFFS